MSFEYIRPIPSPEEIIESMPVPAHLRKIKEARDREIQGVFTRNNNKFLLVIGPCSAHDEDAVCDYVARLAKVQEEIKDKIICVPRIYTNKPRTLGEGYKGMVHQPDHLKSPNFVKGLKAIRKMHRRALEESHLTAADEMLYPTNHPYLDDMLSYVTIGARSVENQQHRMTASGVSMPIGMKNPMSGNLPVMLNSIQAAQLPHSFTYNGWEVRTTGNPLTHAVLRGASNQYGQNIPNYHYEDLESLAHMYRERNCKNPAMIIDTNHSNSNKQHNEQPRIAREVLQSRNHSPMLKELIVGFMIESFIKEGAQKHGEDIYGKSITDPCLGWEKTRALLYEIAENV
jgi:3-deoxy-7-phosphoheptulonate synthase